MTAIHGYKGGGEGRGGGHNMKSLCGLGVLLLILDAEEMPWVYTRITAARLSLLYIHTRCPFVEAKAHCCCVVPRVLKSHRRA